MIERGDIYFVDLDPIKGREQSGHRPVLVISSDSINRLPLVVTVVVGTKGANFDRNYPTNVRVSSQESGLPLETVFLCYQLRSIDSTRFPARKAGKLQSGTMEKVEQAVKRCLGLR
jgi:mRNA interferase MazF